MDVYRQLIQKLKRKKVNFVVLRGFHRKLEENNDLDILLDWRYLPEFFESIGEIGPYVVKSVSPYNLLVYILKDKRWGIDVKLQIAAKGIKLADVTRVFSSIDSYRGIPIPKKEFFLTLLALHLIVEKGRPKEPYSSMMLKSKELLKKGAEELELPFLFKCLILHTNYSSRFSLGLSKIIAMLYLFLRSPLKFLKNWRKLRAVLSTFSLKRAGLVVAFIGPDGAGKTTVISELRKLIPKATVASLGVYNAPYGLKYEIARMRNFKKMKLPNILKNVLRWIDIWLRYFLVALPAAKKGKVVFCDRYFYDLYFYASKGHERFALYLSTLSPPPDLIIYLKAPLHVLLSRKREKTKEELKKSLLTMEKFVELISGKIKVVEVKNISLKKTLSILLPEILEKMEQKGIIDYFSG